MKLYTPRSARVALRRLRPVAETMAGLYRSLEERPRPRYTPDGPVDGAYFALLTSFYRAVRTLREAGVRVQDPRAGLIDFPAVRDGRPVYLCWRVGEETLDHWHEADASPSARRPLDEEGPWEGPTG